MIQWHPGEFSFWVADNIGSVNTSGLESSRILQIFGQRFNLNFNAGYSYVRAVSNGSPEHQKDNLFMFRKTRQTAHFQIGYKRFYSIWLTDFTGRTFITADNADFLPGYSVNNVIGGLTTDLRKTRLDVYFKIENLFNIDYQTIAYYPQPGRSYFMTLSFRFKYEK